MPVATRRPPTRPAVAPSPPPRRLLRLLAALSSGILLAAAFPPLDLGPLALVALVPLLWAWREGGPAWGALYGGAAGLVFFGILLSWSALFGLVAYLPFVAVMSAWWVLVGAVAGWMAGRGVLRPWTVAALWVLAEAGRERWPWGGFSWGEMGYAFHDLPPARSLAALGGVLLLSFLAVLANGLLEALASERSAPSRGGLRWGAGALALAVGVGAVWRQPTAPGARLRVALVQGNDHDREQTADELADRALLFSHLELARGLQGPFDLVVLPESSLDADPRRDPLLVRALPELARERGAAVLANASTDAPEGRLQNTNFHYGPDGRLAGSYAKQRLVPFGEFVPWRDQLDFVGALEQVPVDYLPGRSQPLFRAGGADYGSLICFESGVRPLARSYVRKGAGLLVVVTNNRSFRRSANAAQHLALAQLRAAETGRPVLQAGISGPSAVIEADGHLRTRTGLFERTVLVADTRARTGRTPYVVLGDWILPLAAGLALEALGRHLRRRTRRSAGEGARP